MVRETLLVETVGYDSGSLPLFRGIEDLPVTRRRRHARTFLNIMMLNPYIETILQRLPELGVEAWMTSGCLVNTAWNVMTGRRPYAGINDYDLIYHDPDVSWEAEDAVIQRAAEVFADLGVAVEVRNQARVPLWYEAKFKIAYPPVRAAPYALRRYPSRTTAIAVTRRPGGQIAFYAPFGFEDALRMRVRPNPRLPIPHVYETKAQRWQSTWPSLVVLPWCGDAVEREDAAGATSEAVAVQKTPGRRQPDTDSSVSCGGVRERRQDGR